MHKFDLEERCTKFLKEMIVLSKKVTKDVISKEIIKQLIRACNSIGANYIEANESLSKKDFVYRIKVSRKEVKETIFHIKAIKVYCPTFRKSVDELITEGTELLKIFSTIISKTK